MAKSGRIFSVVQKAQVFFFICPGGQVEFDVPSKTEYSDGLKVKIETILTLAKSVLNFNG